MLSLLLPLALAASPPPTVVSDAEAASLRAGDVAVRFSLSDQAARSTGLLWVHAAAAKVWDAVFDFKARIDETPDLSEVEEYRRGSRWDWGTRFKVGMIGIGGDLFLRFSWDEPGGVCTFALDPERKSWLAVSEGYYKVEPWQGATLLTYAVDTKAGFSPPRFLQKMMADDAMEGLLKAMRARAEKGTSPPAP